MASITLKQGNQTRTDLRTNRQYTVTVDGLIPGVMAVVLVTGPDFCFTTDVPGNLITSSTMSWTFQSGALFETGASYSACIRQNQEYICPKVVWTLTA